MVSIPRYETAVRRLVTLCANPKKALLTSCNTFADMAISCSMIWATRSMGASGSLTVCMSDVYVTEREGSSPIFPTILRNSRRAEQVLQREHLVDGGLKLGDIAWLGQIAVRHGNGACCQPDIGISERIMRGIRIAVANVAEQSGAIHPGICMSLMTAVETAGPRRRAGRLRPDGKLHIPAASLGVQNAADSIEYLAFIVHEQDAFHAATA